MLLRARRPAASARAPETAPSAFRARRQLVFGRHSILIVVAAAACAAAVGSLLPGKVAAVLREPMIQRASALPLDFPHDMHTAVNCLTCHHNYADGRGMEACIACHRSARADLREGVEARFHGFCLECHRHPDKALDKHGPVSGCTACHRAPADLPESSAILELHHALPRGS